MTHPQEINLKIESLLLEKPQTITNILLEIEAVGMAITRPAVQHRMWILENKGYLLQSRIPCPHCGKNEHLWTITDRGREFLTPPFKEPTP